MLSLIITEPSDFSSKAQAILQEHARITLGPLTRTELKNKIEDADILFIRLGHHFDKDMLQNAPKLRYIVTPTTGLNHVDTDYCQENNITIISLRGEVDFLRNIYATAEHCWGLLLALIRHTPQAIQSCAQGFWNREQFKGTELSGKTIGIIGYGRLGKIVARYARAFDMTVIVSDPYARDDHHHVTFTDLPTLARQSDIISVHASYTDETHALLNQSFFSQIKPGAYFINTARGEIVDESALLSALEKGTLAGAALDVLENEHEIIAHQPSKRLTEYTKKYGNLILTPHIGGATYESMHKTEEFVARKLIEHLNGQNT
jgi:D-3-phosphoglycerate dehydrogenase